MTYSSRYDSYKLALHLMYDFLLFCKEGVITVFYAFSKNYSLP